MVPWLSCQVTKQAYSTKNSNMATIAGADIQPPLSSKGVFSVEAYNIHIYIALDIYLLFCALFCYTRPTGVRGRT